MKKDKMNKIWGAIFVLFLLGLFGPFRVYAEQKVTFTGDSAVAPGATVNYVVNLESNDETVITGFDALINYDSSSLTLISTTIADGWEVSPDASGEKNEIKFVSAGTTGNKQVATLAFRVSTTVTASSADITLKNVAVTYKDESDIPVRQPLEDVKKTIGIKSTDNTLKSIKINDVELSNFKSNQYTYNLNVESNVETAKIVVVTTSAKATLKPGQGNRTANLAYGPNTIDIVVVSESGVEQKYTLNINREDNRSTDTTLSSISVDGINIEGFKPKTYKYVVKKYKIDKVEIVGIPNDHNATVTVTPPKTIVVGENNYIITVTSEKGEKGTYTIVINNLDGAINKKLKTLSVKGYDIDFDKNNYRYEIRYNKEKMKDLHIYFTTEGAPDEVKASINPDINNDPTALQNLKPGDEIAITIEGIDGLTSEYTIVILKDNRISFYLLLEIFLLVVILIVVVAIALKRKNDRKKPKKKVASTQRKEPVKKELTKNPVAKAPKKKRFSIFEDEEDDPDFDSDTIEMSEEELKMGKK